MIAHVEPIWRQLLRDGQTPIAIAELLEELATRLLDTPDALVVTEADLRAVCRRTAQAIRNADRLPEFFDNLASKTESRRAADAPIPPHKPATPAPASAAPARRRRRRRGI